MDIISTFKRQNSDCKLCVTTIAGIYSPLFLLGLAALVMF